MNWQIFYDNRPYKVEDKIVTFNAIEAESTAQAYAEWVVRCKTAKPGLFQHLVSVRKVEPESGKKKPCLLCGMTKPDVMIY